MSHPLRIRRPGMRAPIAGAVLIARPSRWGNPFIVGRDGTRRECVDAYLLWLLTQPRLLAEIPRLRGRLLACYCPLDEPCHGDVLARLANEERQPA